MSIQYWSNILLTPNYSKIPNVSSTVTLNTTAIPESHQNVTLNKKRKVNVPPDPVVLLQIWPDSPSPRVAFGIGTSLSYQNVLVSHSLPHTDSRSVPVPWDVGSISPRLTSFNIRPSDQPPELNLGSTQVPSALGEQDSRRGTFD